MIRLQFHFINRDDTIWAYNAAARAADALVGFCHVGVIVTFSINFFCQSEHLHWAVDDTHAATFTTLSINGYSTFETCHNFKFLSYYYV